MAEYHEAFWLALSAAAPVIGLAHAVTVQEAMENRDRRVPLFIAGVLAALALVIDAVVLLISLGVLIDERDRTRTFMMTMAYLLTFTLIALVYTAVLSKAVIRKRRQDRAARR